MNLVVELTTITKELLGFLGIETTSLEVSETEKNTYKIQIESDNAPLLIGKHGDTLMALQHLVKAMVKKKNDDEIILIMDVGNYREQYESKILLMAKQKAEKVIQEDVKETLFPMNSYHRRVVHTYIVSTFPDIETDSIGEEPNRRIVLKKRA